MKMVQEAAFTGYEEETQPFMFGWDLDQNGNPVVDNGSDEKPVLVGVSSRALLQRLDREPRSFILRVDATFKLNQVSYPVLVIGMSDRERRFHLLAVVVLSQIVEEMYTKALAALRRVFEAVANKPLRVYYVMGDADDGQFNSVKNGFGRDNQYVYLMCFFHVMKNVNDRLKFIDERAANRVRKDIYDLHCAENRSDFVRLFYSILPRWRGDPSTAAFAIYFKKMWLTRKFIRWQSFQSPSAYATTNNPAEQFNRVIKRDYTLRAKLKMGSLLRQLQECCSNESEKAHDFGITPKATDDLQRRSKEMDRKSLLQDANVPEDEEVFASNPVVNVLSPCRKNLHPVKDQN
ncbi:hypothetical protein PC121_g5631 [Phytophthora cactorum]|nr:hypothetical protein PC120_g3485 [Phytophthora cactorum]KAG3083661.1 hypothetical protein PC121_g5631 [Phytophthora cactorum]